MRDLCLTRVQCTIPIFANYELLHIKFFACMNRHLPEALPLDSYIATNLQKCLCLTFAPRSARPYSDTYRLLKQQ